MINAVFQPLQQGFYIDLNWLGKFVQVIIEGVGIVGVGVIVFTLILKAITTPFDLYQRINMRKQTLIMKQMQPELEKLQKQYANDKQTYQMKMMELQKKNGYSMLGACLPMLITLGILIVAVTAFQSYARFANLSIYEQMAESYNAAVLDYAVDESDPDAEVTVYQDENGVSFTRVESKKAGVYVYYKYATDAEDKARAYYIDVDKLYEAKASEIDKLMTENVTKDRACELYLVQLGATAARDVFRSPENQPGFLWIKNVWYPDVSYKHPIQDYKSFCGSITGKIVKENGETVTIGDIFSEDDYNNLVSELDVEKTQANGYYILIALTIGLMVLSQFLTMKSSKESNQFSSVDGQAASTQKMMMFMMPLIYAITGFMWTAAFSIYIAVSSVFGIAITLISNLIIGRIFKKKEEEALKQRYTRTVPWKKDDNKK